jgi:hypothetical protein
MGNLFCALYAMAHSVNKFYLIISSADVRCSYIICYDMMNYRQWVKGNGIIYMEY